MRFERVSLDWLGLLDVSRDLALLLKVASAVIYNPALASPSKPEHHKIFVCIITVLYSLPRHVLISW
jgi:hypothetical protein